jgi:hypothetical protein
MFCDLLYLKVHDALKVSEPKRADRFKNAMNCLFEHRVGSVLDRVAPHETRFGGAVVIEDQMKAAWSNSRGEHPKICDYAYVQGGEAILVDGLVAAIVDRVTFNAHIIETGTQSYRLRTSKTSTRCKRAS